MNKNYVIAGAIVIGLLLLYIVFGRSTINSKDIVECNQGEYKLNSEMKEVAKLQNMKVDSIVILDGERSCDVSMKLKKPMLVYGSEISSIPIYTCQKYCFDLMEERNKTVDEQVTMCCG